MKIIPWIPVLFIILFVLSGIVPSFSLASVEKTCFIGGDSPQQDAQPDDTLLCSAYGGEETLRYSVSWLGIKSGELDMRISPQGDDGNRFLIEVTVKSVGLLGTLYPVEDYFSTVVSGRSRLPLRQVMIQQEGRRRNNRVTVYDQINRRIIYTKNNDAPELYEVDGPVHNEFSSFLFLRIMSYVSEIKNVVPTFADRKRHRVEVSYDGREELETIFGVKRTLAVSPHLTFKGLYQKVGDPRIWLIDDPFRIPVRIKAKIIIGSLTADLIEYQGPPGIFRSEKK